jgi:hypothetical protein
MVTFLLIVSLVVATGLLLFLTTRTVISVSYRNHLFRASLTVLGCGVEFNGGRRQVGVVCGPLRFFPRQKRATPKRETAAKPAEASPAPVPKRKSGRKLSLGVMVRVLKALVLFVGEILSRFSYDRGKIEVQPVFADPALAGIAYGWGQAFYGIFPRARNVIAVDPVFGAGETVYSGYVIFSIKNRQIIGPGFRLFGNLPIRKLMASLFSKKG